MEFKCIECNKEFQTRSGLWKHIVKHNKIKTLEEQSLNNLKTYNCRHCDKKYKNKQNRWFHEKKCKENNKNPLTEQIKKLSDEIDKLKQNNNLTNNNNNSTNNNHSHNHNMTNCNNNNNITNNIQFILVEPGTESIENMSLKRQRKIMNNGINCLTPLIKYVNFNKKFPKNQNYCVTSVNAKYASVVNTQNNSIIKTDKNEFFDKMLLCYLSKLEEISKNPKFKTKERIEYAEKIQELKTLLFQNKSGLQKYYSEINYLSYNYRDLVLKTWSTVGNLKNKKLDDNTSSDSDSSNDSDCSTSSCDSIKQKRQDDIKKRNTRSIIPSLEDMESDESEKEDDFIEIKIKGEVFLLDSSNIYYKTPYGKGVLYGKYINGKIKKLEDESNKEIIL